MSPVHRQVTQVVVFEGVLVGESLLAASTLERLDVEVVGFDVLLEVVPCA